MSHDSSRAPSYAAVLRLPHARRTFGAALLGRLSYGTVFISLTLALASSGSLARTGTVVALFALTTAFLAPFRATLIERFGIRRALLPMALVYALFLIVLAAATWRPGLGSPALLDGAALAAGACAPPLGPTMRRLWSAMCGEDRGLLQRAYSLDTVVEEVLFISGPLLVGLLVLVARPAAGLVLSAALVAAGAVALVTSPVLAGVPEAAGTAGSRGSRQLGRILAPLVVAAGAGLGLGAQSLVVAAFVVHRGQTSALPWVEAAMSVGSVVGGLVYGALSWRLADRQRLPRLAVGLGVTVAAAGLSPNVYVLAGAAGVIGLFVSPTLTCAYLVADELAAPAARTGAGVWVNNAFNAGSSGGYAAIGLAVARVPVGLCFVLAGLPMLVGAALAAARSAEPVQPGPVAVDALDGVR